MEKIARRSILKALEGLVLFMVAPVFTLKNALAESFPTRTVEAMNFSFDTGTGTIRWKGQESETPYELRVDGLVETPVTLSYTQLRALPSVTQVSDFHCVEGWTIPRVTWGGFKFKELLRLVKPLEDAKYVVFHALGQTASRPQGQRHYLESFALDALLNSEEDILMALDKDGKPLSEERGAPLRVIAPLRLAYKSIKFVHRIEFSKQKQPGWWTLANSIYDWEARVPQRRLRPR